MSGWEELEQVVSRRVLDDALRVSAALTELGVPHALVGGLAVGLHGHPRATKDVDFLVGPEAFASITPLLTFRAELADVVQWGKIDLIAALPEDPLLANEVAPGGRNFIPVVGLGDDGCPKDLLPPNAVHGLRAQLGREPFPELDVEVRLLRAHAVDDENPEVRQVPILV